MVLDQDAVLGLGDLVAILLGEQWDFVFFLVLL